MNVERKHLAGLHLVLAEADTASTDSISVGELEALIAQASAAPEQAKMCDCNQGRLPCSCKQVGAAPEQEAVAWLLSVEGYKDVLVDNYQRALSEQEHFLGRGRTCVITNLYTHADPSEVERLRAENKRLNQIINSPQSDDFIRAVSTEAEHQRQRWGSAHDEGKAPSDWFWLVGYLAGKALHSHAAGDLTKAEHHVITTAAAIANWHRSMFGKTDMRPGTAQPAEVKS